MFKKIKIFRNKYLFTLLVFGIYTLFLDSSDIFSIIHQRLKLSELRAEKRALSEKYIATKKMVEQLDSNNEALERFARENKFFKKDNEDIFVIVYED